MADHYETSVNKGDINMRALARELNERYENGWKLAHAFEQGGNMILIWERIASV